MMMMMMLSKIIYMLKCQTVTIVIITHLTVVCMAQR